MPSAPAPPSSASSSSPAAAAAAAAAARTTAAATNDKNTTQRRKIVISTTAQTPRTAHDDPPPQQRPPSTATAAPAVPAAQPPDPLEEKLELLEARFTAPLLLLPAPPTPALASPPGPDGGDEPRHQRDRDDPAAASSLIAADIHPSYPQQEGDPGASLGGSCWSHSFGFDPPSRAALAAAAGAGAGAPAAAASAAGRAPQQARGNPASPSSSYAVGQVERAAALQMAKAVQRAGAAPASSSSAASVVCETPPPPLPPDDAALAASEPSGGAPAPAAAEPPGAAADAKSSKRKQPAPARNLVASVRDTASSAGATAPIESAIPGTAALPSSSTGPRNRKRSREPLRDRPSPSRAGGAANSASSSSSRTAVGPAAAENSNASLGGKGAAGGTRGSRGRSSNADGRSAVTARTSPAKPSSPPPRKKAKEPKAASTANNPRGHAPAASPAPLPPGEAETGPAAAAAAAPPPQTAHGNKIYDFFDIKRRSIRPPRPASPPEHREEGRPRDGGADSSRTAPPSSRRGSGGDVDVTEGASTASNAALRDLQSEVERLRREIGDKDEQLRAVANNRSLLHDALQKTLASREDEIRMLEGRLDETARRYKTSLETMVRSQAERDARALRDQLAVDGARLGRIVVSRAGMRSVETWEDGPALRQVRIRRRSLASRAAALQERQNKIRRVAANQQAVAPDPPNASAAVSLSGLEEADEAASLAYHLANLEREQSDLQGQERDLQLEKTRHIRALKRVASEDASRFRSRPKLHDRYVLLLLLGRGGFSEVWKAYDLAELREVAVKIHQLDPRWSDAKKESFTKHVSREYEIHRGVRHPRIVSLLDVFEIDMNSFATVLECCHGTDLDTLLKERGTLPEAEARAVLIQILVGMRYLSQPSLDGTRQGIIHMDIKPANILFDENGDAKITDFGLSKILESADAADTSLELTSQGAGTYWYLPPECFVVDRSVRISNKVDVWAIGVIFYQMLYGRRPFGDGMTQDRILSDRTMLGARTVPFPDEGRVGGGAVVSPEARDFVRACLRYDQADRPTIAQLCEHPYVLSLPLPLSPPSRIAPS